MSRPQLKLIVVGFLPALLLLLFQGSRLSKLSENERFLLLTAHPDDECFFFGPTLRALSPQTDNLFSLTVSNGNFDGIGRTREPELRSSLAILGIPPERSFLLNHPQLQDNFTQTWDPEIIAEATLPYILGNRITTILTFDHLGVSSHPNHYSLYYGVKYILASIPPNIMVPRAYALITEPLIIKYSGWLSVPFKSLARLNLSRDANAEGLPTLRFTSGISSYLITFQAMNQHRSQMVWFRWLYLLFSSYMWQNDWVEIHPTET